MSRKYNALSDVKVDWAEVQRRGEQIEKAAVTEAVMRIPVLYVEAILAEYDDSADPRTDEQRAADEFSAEVAETINSVRPY